MRNQGVREIWLRKKLLRDLGFELIVRDLLTTRWEADTLRGFFSQDDVQAWFNMSAPEIKSGAICIDSIGKAEAINLMRRYPILIRRPLMQCGTYKQSGFVVGDVFDALGITTEKTAQLDSCQMPSNLTMCGDTS